MQEEHGLLVPPHNAEAMAAAIARLLHSPQQRRQMGMAAAEHAQRHYGMERMTSTYLQWYEEIIANNPRPSSTTRSEGNHS